MEKMVFAASLMRPGDGRSRTDLEALERLYAGARSGHRDVARIVAAIGGIALFARLLAIAAG